MVRYEADDGFDAMFFSSEQLRFCLLVKSDICQGLVLVAITVVVVVVVAMIAVVVVLVMAVVV